MLWLPLSIVAIDLAENAYAPEYDESKVAGAASSTKGVGARVTEVTSGIFENIKCKGGVEMNPISVARSAAKGVESLIARIKNKWGSGTAKVLAESTDRVLYFNKEKVKKLAAELRKKIVEKSKDINAIDAATVVWLISEIMEAPEQTGSAAMVVEESAVGELAKDVALDSALIATIVSTKDDLERKSLMQDLSLKMGLTLDQLYLLFLIATIVGHMDVEKINLTGIDKIVLMEY